MRKDDTVRLRHMLDAAREAVSFISGKTRTSLDEDRLLVLALIKSVEIIGEAAARTNQEFRNQNPSLPWTDIIGMRNRLIHAYFDINLDILWKTVTEDIPPLIDELRKLVPED